MDKTIQDIVATWPQDIIEMGQISSICSAFLEGEYISATVKEIASVLANRWKDYPLQVDLEKVLPSMFRKGVMLGYIEESIIPNKFMPTFSGWMVAEDYCKNVLAGHSSAVPA